MDEFILRIFQSEVRRQCEFALMAADDLKHSLDASDVKRIWYSVQALLAAAGNVSKLFWPSDSKLPERGQDLRASLGVPEKSPLESRAFRNHFEHFDSRLEIWAVSSEHKNFVDSNIGVSISGVDRNDFLRNFEPGTLTLTFCGEEHPLEPVIDAIQQIYRIPYTA